MGSLKEERKTTGWAARDPSGVLSPYTFTLRNTGAEDVLIKVICCGVCHTDLHQIKNDLGMSNYPMACRNSLAVKAERWSESSHRFLKRCSDSGNAEASYILGMIRFYCLQNRGSGASLMAKAAIRSHAPALYSLAVIQFNGSGGKKNDRDLRAGVALCARAAFLGHIDVLRELGHCLQDGYGINKNIPAGRRLLIQANTRELAGVLPTTQNHLRFLPFPGKQIFHRNPQIAGPSTGIPQIAGPSSNHHLLGTILPIPYHHHHSHHHFLHLHCPHHFPGRRGKPVSFL